MSRRRFTGALCVLAGALAACRGERPPDAAGPTPTTATATPDAPPALPPPPPVMPDEPAVELRRRFVEIGALVVNVHAMGPTWVNGELTEPQKVIAMLEAEGRREGGPRKVVLLCPAPRESGVVGQIAAVTRRAGLLDVVIAFHDPEFAGLAPGPSVAAAPGGDAPPPPPGGAPPGVPPTPPGTGG